MTALLDRPIDIDLADWTETERAALQDALTRRRLVGAAAAIAALGRNAAQAQTPGATPEGPWTFTDDRGITVNLPTRPKRIVAQINSAAALWDLGIKPIAVFGSVTQVSGEREPTTGNVDLDAVAVISNGYEDPDLEQLLALDPDLIVSTTWGAADPSAVWGVAPESVPLMEQIAPIVVLSIVDTTLLQVIGRFEELAASLGADLTAPDVVAAKAAFEAARDDVRAALAEKPGLQTMFIAGSPDTLYVCGPSYYIDVRYFQELGLQMVDPPADYGTELLSWEQAGKYPVDLIFNDARSHGGYLRTEELLEIPTFAALPAAQAGQIANWYYEYVASYAGFTFVLTELAKTIRASRADVVG